MKIDAFSLNLSSTREYSQTQSVETSESYAFLSALEDQQEKLGTDNSVKDDSQSGVPITTSQETQVAEQEQTTVSLSEQFKKQLIIMRQIAIAMLTKCQENSLVSGDFRVKSLDQIYAGSGLQNNYSIMSQWEYTQKNQLFL
jgi:hypothetical protein